MRVAGERGIIEEVSAAETPSRTRDDYFGVASALGRGDRVERGGAGQVRGGTVARVVDQRQRESAAQAR